MPTIIDGTSGVTFNDNSVQAASAFFKRNNILGTVSQASGVPTGAVIERGSNANGEFVRFSDGTQICSGYFSSANSGWKSGGLLVPFPAAFSNALFNLVFTLSTDATIWSGVALIDATYVSNGAAFRIRPPNGITDSGTSVRGSFVTTGLWF